MTQVHLPCALFFFSQEGEDKKFLITRLQSIHEQKRTPARRLTSQVRVCSSFLTFAYTQNWTHNSRTPLKFKLMGVSTHLYVKEHFGDRGNRQHFPQYFIIAVLDMC